MDTTNVRRLRFALEQKLGRRVPLREIADAIGMDRSRLNKIELGFAKELRGDELIRLRDYFTVQLGRVVSDDEIVRYESNSLEAFTPLAA